MFDDFIVKVNDDKKDDDYTCNVEEVEEYDDTLIENDQLDETLPEKVEETNIIEEENTEEENNEIIEQEDIQDTEIIASKEEPEQIFQPYDFESEPEVIEKTYTEEDLKLAVEQAEEQSYNKGLEDARNSIMETQNILFEDIKKQLMMVFASLEDKKSELENSALKFSISLVEKIFPSMEKEFAEKEVKKFLSENFANFSSQEALSFSFNPDMLSHISGTLRRLAEQNDFEGKISVHKDPELSLSDCRVEWKSGGVERKSSIVIDKVKKLINFNEQERGNE